MATVLVVDDISIFRLRIKQNVEKLGHKVVAEAESGYEAIEMYKKFQPDFVTMDITMPMRNGIRDGIEAVAGIIKIDPKAKIIMITSHGEQDQVIKAIRAGASNYILKPLDVEKFKQVLEKLDIKGS